MRPDTLAAGWLHKVTVIITGDCLGDNQDYNRHREDLEMKIKVTKKYIWVERKKSDNPIPVRSNSLWYRDMGNRSMVWNFIKWCVGRAI